MKRYHDAELVTSGVKTAKKPVIGEMLEYEIEAMMKNKEPIRGTTEPIFTRKRDGVLAAYNPRTDKFDEMITAANEMAIGAAKEVQTLREQEAKQEAQQKQEDTE